MDATMAVWANFLSLKKRPMVASITTPKPMLHTKKTLSSQIAETPLTYTYSCQSKLLERNKLKEKFYHYNVSGVNF